eukprot:scaffold278736_cov31-Prasinocladus_malaysianus.AAC.1
MSHFTGHHLEVNAAILQLLTTDIANGSIGMATYIPHNVRSQIMLTCCGIALQLAYEHEVCQE